MLLQEVFETSGLSGTGNWVGLYKCLYGAGTRVGVLQGLSGTGNLVGCFYKCLFGTGKQVGVVQGLCGTGNLVWGAGSVTRNPSQSAQKKRYDVMLRAVVGCNTGDSTAARHFNSVGANELENATGTTRSC